jgi:16S rRNA (guanine1207-N2)-methyltransferase
MSEPTYDTSTARPSERLLIELIPQLAAARVLCTSLGRAQFAFAFAAAHPESHVVCNFLDLFQSQQAGQGSTGAGRQGGWGAGEQRSVAITCEANLLTGEYDLAALPITMQGDAELTRDLLQQAYQRLVDGGKLVAATDNPRDSWLHEELRKLATKVTRLERPDGVIYSLVKQSPLKKVKDFSCEFAFRDGERLLKVVSRPGVFSHRKIDTGARALIEVMQIEPGQRVFDIGCGSGVVALAAASRAENVSVYAVDSNPRAVECTRRGAGLNRLSNVTAVLNADGDCDAPGTYDVALANPPYYSHFKIAEIFLDGARRALKPGGRVYVVTKHPAWYEEAMPTVFGNVTAVEKRGYVVYSGQRRG